MSALRVALIGAATLAMIFVSGCGPSYPDCANDSHCQEQGEYCADKKCRQCRDDSHCAGACSICTEGYSCSRIVGCCSTDLDCPNGRCWKDPSNPGAVGQCGGECKAGHPASKCPPGQQCVNGACQGCSGDESCPPGQRCVNGTCVGACELTAVEFDYNEYSIRLDQEAQIRANVECLQGISGAVRVEGHCDERGSDEYNLALGQRRANAVVRAYKSMGVSNSLSTISYGEEKPKCTRSNESCWKENRRAESVR